MRIVERAQVISAEGGRARVVIGEPEDPSKCEHCAQVRCCGAGSPGPRELEVVCPPDTRQGEMVTVELELASPAWAAFLLFILPMGVAFSVGLAVYSGTTNSALGLLGGVAGAAATYAAVHFLSAGSEPCGRVVRR